MKYFITQRKWVKEGQWPTIKTNFSFICMRSCEQLTWVYIQPHGSFFKGCDLDTDFRMCCKLSKEYATVPIVLKMIVIACGTVLFLLYSTFCYFDVRRYVYCNPFASLHCYRPRYSLLMGILISWRVILSDWYTLSSIV